MKGVRISVRILVAVVTLEWVSMRISVRPILSLFFSSFSVIGFYNHNDNGLQRTRLPCNVLCGYINKILDSQIFRNFEKYM